MSEKKVEKKVIFIFANFFFKIHFGHFFMSNFKIKKKVLKTPSFSIFSTPEKLSFILDFSISWYLLCKIRIFVGTFGILYSVRWSGMITFAFTYLFISIVLKYHKNILVPFMLQQSFII